MGRVLLLVMACVVAAQGGFGVCAGLLGLAGYGDVLAAVVIAWLVAVLLRGSSRRAGQWSARGARAPGRGALD